VAFTTWLRFAGHIDRGWGVRRPRVALKSRLDRLGLPPVFGLDRAAVQEYFAEFIAAGASADQIEFVGMVIEHLTRNGVVDAGLLYDSPFSDLSPDGPESVFDERNVDRFLARLRTLNQTAEVSDTSADVV
jgi:type I restriction enzyme R subunit